MPIRHLSTTLVVILATTLAVSQQPAPSFTAANFPTEILQFNPVQREGVSKASYDIAVRILDETRKAAKGDPQNLNASDYWNITTALNRLHEPKQSISLAFSQAIKSDPKAICGYVQAKLILDNIWSIHLDSQLHAPVNNLPKPDPVARSGLTGWVRSFT